MGLLIANESFINILKWKKTTFLPASISKWEALIFATLVAKTVLAAWLMLAAWLISKAKATAYSCFGSAVVDTLATLVLYI